MFAPGQLRVAYIGIREIEEYARDCTDIARIMSLHNSDEPSIFTAEEMLELNTRGLVRGDFSSVIGGRKAVPDVRALERVLFDTVYPCPPIKRSHLDGRNTVSPVGTSP